MTRCKNILIIILVLLWRYDVVMAAGAGDDVMSRLRERYTLEHPLIYEDAWTKSPYAFVNSEGEPDGFDVELIREVMRRTGLPYEIRMRHQDTVHVDLQNRRADLSFGVSARYNSPYGLFGSVTLSQFENSLLVPRSDSVPRVSLSQLRNMHIVVSRGSRAHAYLKDGGIPDSTITVTDNMIVTILDMVSRGEGGVLWNTVSMKWLLKKYAIHGYALVPTDIPAGEYRFMSHDPQLLHVLDSVALVMQQEGEIDQITNRWMYPERKEQVPYVMYVLLVLVVLSAIVALITQAIRYYRTYYSHSTLNDINNQMELILSSMGGVSVWTYDVIGGNYAWMTHRGTVEEEYNSFEFSRFYPDQDFYVIHSTVLELIKQPGTIVTKTLRRYADASSDDIIDIEVSMQAVTDDYGKVYLVCGVQNNITDSKAHLERMRLLSERYKTAFNISLGAIIRFDADGNVVQFNRRFCEWMGMKDDTQLQQMKFNIRDVSILRDIDIDHDFEHSLSFCGRMTTLDDYAPMPLTGERYFHVHIVKAYGEDGKLISYMAYMREMTEDVRYYRDIRDKESSTHSLREESELCRQRRDDALRQSDIVMMRYYPEAKRLFYYDRGKGRMVTIPQLRVIQMIESRHMKAVFKAFYHADTLEDREMHLVVGTLMRNAEGERMQMEVHMCPFKNEAGNVLYYFGMCKDVTTQVEMQRQLADETLKAREAEQVRQNFIRNISYSIRQPLVMIQKNLSAYKNDETIENERALVDGIKVSTQRLVTLSDDIFILSRVEAGMYTQEVGKHDFVKVYNESLNKGIQPYRQSTVTYKIENTYESLPLSFDVKVVSRILSEAVALSARYTHYGTVNVRYMYRKNHLTVAIEDNGQGIPPDLRDHIFELHINANYTSSSSGVMLSGLELPICHAFVKMLGGSIDVESRTGHGTLIYIQLPIKE
ncbi:MAG: transporter substrate-binding domain-containing protein [Prevotella sp.]|nr:transporter substrate-binding domain-containing protein [Prevotella sp.]